MLRDKYEYYLLVLMRHMPGVQLGFIIMEKLWIQRSIEFGLLGRPTSEQKGAGALVEDGECRYVANYLVAIF